MSEGFEEIERVIGRLGQLALDTRQVEKPLKVVGALVVASVHKNFQEQGRPQKWNPLSPRTLAGRRHGKGKGGVKILIDSARLKNSIGYKLVSSGGEPAVSVGTNVIYARRQHFGYGGGLGRGHAKTPAREFLLIQHPEDTGKIEGVFRRHVERK
jgi:phage gpG-like protein